MAFNLRDCTESDLTLILPLWTDIVDHTKLTPEVETPTLGSLVSLWRNVRSAGYPFLISFQGENVVGWALLRRYAGVTDTAFRFTAVAESWVVPEALNLGIGNRQQKELLKRLKTLPVKELMIAMTNDVRIKIEGYGLDFPGSTEIGQLENVCEKNGEQFSVFIRQMSTGWTPKL